MSGTGGFGDDPGIDAPGSPVTPSPVAASPDTGRPLASGPEKAREGSAPSSPDVLARTVSPFTLAQRLEAAETRLAAVEARCREWAALAPPDDWGLTPTDTVAADCGRAILGIIGSDKDEDRG